MSGLRVDGHHYAVVLYPNYHTPRYVQPVMVGIAGPILLCLHCCGGKHKQLMVLVTSLTMSGMSVVFMTGKNGLGCCRKELFNASDCVSSHDFVPYVSGLRVCDALIISPIG